MADLKLKKRPSRISRIISRTDTIYQNEHAFILSTKSVASGSINNIFADDNEFLGLKLAND